MIQIWDFKLSHDHIFKHSNDSNSSNSQTVEWFQETKRHPHTQDQWKYHHTIHYTYIHIPWPFTCRGYWRVAAVGPFGIDEWWRVCAYMCWSIMGGEGRRIDVAGACSSVLSLYIYIHRCTSLCVCLSVPVDCIRIGLCKIVSYL